MHLVLYVPFSRENGTTEKDKNHAHKNVQCRMALNYKMRYCKDWKKKLQLENLKKIVSTAY